MYVRLSPILRPGRGGASRQWLERRSTLATAYLVRGMVARSNSRFAGSCRLLFNNNCFRYKKHCSARAGYLPTFYSFKNLETRCLPKKTSLLRLTSTNMKSMYDSVQARYRVVSCIESTQSIESTWVSTKNHTPRSPMKPLADHETAHMDGPWYYR